MFTRAIAYNNNMFMTTAALVCTMDTYMLPKAVCNDVHFGLLFFRKTVANRLDILDCSSCLECTKWDEVCGNWYCISSCKHQEYSAVYLFGRPTYICW